MKTLLKFVVVVALSGVFGLTSCSKKSDDIEPNPTDTKTPDTKTPDANTPGFYAKIDGKEYRPDMVYSLVTMPANDGYYGIYGLDSKTGDVVVIGLPYAALVGTHALSYVNYGSLSLGDGSNSFSTRYEPGVGTITITSMTKTNVVGTFTFTAYSDKGVKRTITEGKFNVPFK
jgi:hypothetical protein